MTATEKKYAVKGLILRQIDVTVSV